MATNKIYLVAKNTTANGAVLLLLAAFLAVVVYNGNLGYLASALKQDLFTRSQAGPAFWQWAVGLIVLYALAENPNTSQLFGPLLAIALVALLIQLATKQPTLFQNLTSGINRILGGT
jgi:hypothetical protein